ncbi:hypothetical protein LARV_01166 [Longilinea arvoryzae]|uniref:Polymer-forming cytoskeletal protein n=1 Tax=Longilinea arvoryzae TaxID=360412 RepID=A0A0S7BER9_9CHLR|nr:polymer-forming cytoskeletal protein [Longilinea arvoryzae]GAP13412.1 hypothetical protein LARV_01166 [Longilinea arvoryzae]
MNASSIKGFRWLLVFILVLGLALAATRPVQAADFDNDGRIEAGEVIDDDVFLAGDQVVVDGTVNGLVIAAGQSVLIHGVINGDLIATGQTVFIGEDAQISGNVFSGSQLIDLRGKVDGSLLGGAMELRLADGAEIGRNVFFGGYSSSAAAGSSIQRDAYLAVYQTQLNGKVGRDAVVEAAVVEIGGDIGRNASLTIGETEGGYMSRAPIVFGYEVPTALTPGLRIARDANIGGQLTYTSQADYSAQIQSEPSGGVVYQTPVPTENGRDRIFKTTHRSGIAGRTINAVRDLITLLILGALALWLIPGLLKRVVAQAAAKPLPSAGVGFLAILATYAGGLLAAALLFGVGILFSLITLGGLSNLVFGVGFSGLGLILAVFTFLVVTGSKVVAAYLVGDLIFERLAPQAQGRKVWALVAGVLIYVILSALPFVGWVFVWIATFVGLGAIWFAWQNRKNTEVVATPVL